MVQWGPGSEAQLTPGFTLQRRWGVPWTWVENDSLGGERNRFLAQALMGRGKPQV